MRALLDTCVLIWWLGDKPQLSTTHRALIADGGNQVFVSAVSVTEISIKTALGKLPAPPRPLPHVVRESGFSPLALTLEHAEALGHLPQHHGDPFDRMLIAQAAVEGLTILTADPRFQVYSIPVA